MNLRGISPSTRIRQIMQSYDAPIKNTDLVCFLDASDIASYPGFGTSWFDLSGNGKNATLVGEPQFISDNGGCFRFTSISTYATLPTPLLDITSAGGNGSFALEAWIRPTSVPNAINPILSINVSGSANNVSLVIASDRRFGINIGGTPTTQYHQTVATLNTWYHVVVSRDVGFASSVYNYFSRTTVNAVASTNAYLSDGASVASSSPRIAGTSGNSNFFSGDIAQIRIYNNRFVSNDIYKNFAYHRSRFGVV